MSAVASNRDGRRLIVAGSLLCFRHEHRQCGTAFHPLRGTQGSSQKPIDQRTILTTERQCPPAMRPSQSPTLTAWSELLAALGSKAAVSLVA
jgi:hypothetical protein